LRRAFIFASLLLSLLVPAAAQNTLTASGHVITGGGNGVPSGSFYRFTLSNCYGTPRLIDSGTIVQAQIDAKPTDSTGAFSVPLARNDKIDCNGVANSAWNVSVYRNNVRIDNPVTYCLTADANFDNPPAPCQPDSPNTSPFHSFKLRPEGYVAGAIYNPYDVVSVDESGIFVCLKRTSTVAPGDDPTFWTRVLGPGTNIGPRIYVQTFTNLQTWAITHNFNDPNVVANFYDDSGQLMFPDSFTLTNANTATATFTTPQSGKVIVETASNFSVIPLTDATQAIVSNPVGNQVISGTFDLSNYSYTATHGIVTQDLVVNGMTTLNGTLNVPGGITGNTAGTHTGPVTGAVTGNVVGDVNSSGTSTFNILNSTTTDAGTLSATKINGDTYTSRYASLNAQLAATTAGHTAYVDQNATLTSSVTLTGITLECKPGVTVTKGYNGNGITVGTNGTLRNCAVEGNKANFATGAAVYLSGVTNARVENNVITNSADAGISSYSSTHVHITRNKITGSTQNGILIHQGGSNIFVDKNYIDCTGGTTDQSDCIGVYSETGNTGPANVALTDNVMQNGVSDFCIEIGSFGGTTPPSNITMKGNICSAAAASNHGGYSIADGSTFVTATGNVFSGNGFANDIAAFEIAGATTGSPTTNVFVSGNSAECYGPCVSISAKEQDLTVGSNEFRVMVNSSKAINISNSTAGVDLLRVNIIDNSILLNGTSDGIVAQCNSTGGNCADWVIKGNHVNGSNLASNTGIQVTQSAGTMQRVIVQDNSVNNLSLGYAWNSPTLSKFFGNTSTNVTTHLSSATAPGANFKLDDSGGLIFTQLGSFQNGSRAYCSDCTIANPCAGSGTGAIAKRLNGVWVCN
jgi:hypothetical protein